MKYLEIIQSLIFESAFNDTFSLDLCDEDIAVQFVAGLQIMRVNKHPVHVRPSNTGTSGVLNRDIYLTDSLSLVGLTVIPSKSNHFLHLQARTPIIVLSVDSRTIWESTLIKMVEDFSLAAQTSLLIIREHIDVLGEGVCMVHILAIS